MATEVQIGSDSTATDAEADLLNKAVALAADDDGDDPGAATTAEADEEAEHSGRRDTELETATSDEAREEIRRHRKSRSARLREKNEMLERQLADTQQQLGYVVQTVNGLQGNMVSQQLQRVDAEIGTAQHVMRQAAAAEADALTKGDGQTAVQAREIGVQARQKIEYLSDLKSRATTQLNTRPAPLDPRVMNHGRAFSDENPWYHHNSNEPDSTVLTALDAGVLRDGFDPRTPAYWDELRARMGKYLPHRAKTGYNGVETAPAGTARSPVAGSGNSVPGAGGERRQQGGYQVSAERVRAMKDAGVWDDPKAREKQIKAYQKYDRDAADR